MSFDLNKFDLNKIKQAYSQPKTYNWSSYTSSKPSTSNFVGKSDVAFGNTPKQSADSISDDFGYLSQESDANYYESRGYTFDGKKWVSPIEQMLQKSAQDVRNIPVNTPVNNSWFNGNRTYWENQAKNAYSQLNSDQRSLIDKDNNGSFSLEEIRDYQRANGLAADGKLGNNTMTHLITPSEEKTYDAGQLPEIVVSAKKPVSPVKQSRPLNKIGARKFNMKEIVLNDGSVAYKDPHYGFIYYNNGRVKTNQGMGNYTFENGRISYYQQGGSMNNTEEMQRAFMAFLIEDASTQGITIQSEEDLVKYTEALGEEGIKAKYQEFIKKMQGGIKAKYGAKLTQVRKLKGLCADDEELVYLKQGGRVCPVCQKKMKKAQEGTKVKKNAIEEFKNSRKQHVNPDDTVHVKPGVPRSLVNSDGSVVDKRFPAYSAEEYQRDLKTKDGRKRVLKQDIIASKCGGKTKKR